MRIAAVSSGNRCLAVPREKPFVTGTYGEPRCMMSELRGSLGSCRSAIELRPQINDLAGIDPLF
jgi:hypothetical protein